jgi:hypothetical protein
MAMAGGHGPEPNPVTDADLGGRRSLLIAGFSSAAGLGMIAAAWALVRWPAAVIGSIDRVFRVVGAPSPLDDLARQSHDATGATPGGARP